MDISNNLFTFDISKMIIMKILIVYILFITPLFSYSQVDDMSTNEKDMIACINILRTNPKSAIPYVETYIRNQITFVNGKRYVNTKNITEAKALISILTSTKSLSPLATRMDMFIITKAYAKHLDSLGVLEHKNTQERFKSLGIFVSENLVYNNTNGTWGVIIDLMVDSGVRNHIHRLNLLDTTIKSVSVAKVNNVWVQNFSQK